jgi:succinate dehydrogenase / fumarate reductase cytochrome b subunit
MDAIEETGKLCAAAFDAAADNGKEQRMANGSEAATTGTAKRVERPLSPHLQVYRIQITSVSSIVTRITGQALMAGVILGVWWLLAASISDQYFATANAVVTSWFGKLVFTGSLWAVWYHYLAGLRHLYFDAGHGLEIGTAERLGWACVIGSVVLTVLTILIV